MDPYCLLNKKYIQLQQKFQMIQFGTQMCKTEIFVYESFLILNNYCYQFFIRLGIYCAKMDIGGAFGIFIGISIVLIGLSCLLLKYYSYRRKRLLQQASETYQFNEQCYKQTEQIIEGAYNEFQHCRQRQNIHDDVTSKRVQEDMLIEMSDIKQLLNVSNNIYGVSTLRKKLNNDTPPINSQTNRSLATLKSFRFERLNTMESSKTQRKYYDYVKKLVKYSKRGITINQVNVDSIKKKKGEIIPNQKMIESTTLKDGQYFQDLLQIHGFQKYCYGYYKYVCSIDVTDVKQNQSYPLTVLKLTDSKEMLLQDQYFRLHQQLIKTK